MEINTKPMHLFLTILGLILLGLASGTAINYITDVLPMTRRLSSAVCKNCQEKLPWKQYVLLNKCEHCGQARSRRSWLVLLITPVIYLLLWFFPIERMGFWTETVILLFFSIVAITDLEYRVILHPVVLAGVALGLGVGYMLHGIVSTLIGGATGFVFMLIIYYLGQGFARLMSRVRQEEIDEIPLGFGDVNLSCVLGLMLGWPGITAGLLLAILLGGGFSALFIIGTKLSKQYKPFVAIPYAPFLLLGAVILLFRP